MAMSWSDRASSPNNRTSPDSVQATAAEEEAHKHGPFYRNSGKTGDKQSSQPSAPRSNTGSPRTVPADFRQAFPSQAPFHKEAKERDSPEHAHPIEKNILFDKIAGIKKQYLYCLNLCLLTCIGCTNRHNRQNDMSDKDPLSNLCSAINTNVVHEQDYVIDTVVGIFIYIVVLKTIRISYLLQCK